MLNKELIMYDGSRFYPAWLTKADRQELRNRISDQNERMYCGCRSDCKLWYSISTDLRIYPSHRGYAHMPNCIYAENSRDRSRFAFVQDGASGETRAFLNFKPSTFTVPYEPTDKERKPSEETEQKDDFKYFSLERFVRQLNIDTWNERMAVGKGVLSADYFSSALFGRLKSIIIDGCVKSLREYRVDTDGWGFFYQDFDGYDMRLKADGNYTCSLTVNGSDGKKYSWFIYEKTLSVALKRFMKFFGKDPKDMLAEGQKIIMSGFRYQRTRKGSPQPYKVVGRLCFYAVSSSGLIARSPAELETLENISKLLRFKKDDDLRYFISDEGEDYFGYFEKKGDPRKFIITGVENNYPGAAVYVADILDTALSLDQLKGFLR